MKQIKTQTKKSVLNVCYDMVLCKFRAFLSVCLCTVRCRGAPKTYHVFIVYNNF